MNIFSMDNALFRAIDRFVDLIWLNLLTLLCAIPIVTAGASLTAMYHVLLKMALKEEGTVTVPFFKAFRSNFKNATKVWIPSVLIFCVYLYNIYLLRAGIMDGLGKMKVVSGCVIAVMMFFLLMILNYVFPLFARYDNGIKQTLKNAVLLSFAYFPKSLCMIVLLFFPLAFMRLTDYFFWLWFLYGLSFPGYLIAQLISGIFTKTEDVGNLDDSSRQHEDGESNSDNDQENE